MLDDAAVFLGGAGQKAGNVFERDQRDVEAVAETYEAGPLYRGIDVERACQHSGLVGNDTDGAAMQAGKADHDVLGVVFLDFEEVAIIDHRVNHVLDVVRAVRLGRHHLIERWIGAVHGIGAGLARRILQVVRRQEAQQLAHHRQTFRVIPG